MTDKHGKASMDTCLFERTRSHTHTHSSTNGQVSIQLQQAQLELAHLRHRNRRRGRKQLVSVSQANQVAFLSLFQFAVLLAELTSFAVCMYRADAVGRAEHIETTSMVLFR